jgi:hypothetical protein
VTRRFTTGPIFEELTAAAAAAAASATDAATASTTAAKRTTEAAAAPVRLSEGAMAVLQRNAVCLVDRRRAPAIDSAQWSSSVSARRYA